MSMCYTAIRLFEGFAFTIVIRVSQSSWPVSRFISDLPIGRHFKNIDTIRVKEPKAIWSELYTYQPLVTVQPVQ
jgi:hypothetical protein